MQTVIYTYRVRGTERKEKREAKKKGKVKKEEKNLKFLLTNEQELWIRFLAFGMWHCTALLVGDTNFLKENVSAIFSEEVGRCDREREIATRYGHHMVSE